MSASVETVQLCHGLCAVVIPKGLPAAEVRAIRERLGLVCRHGSNARRSSGWCPACAAHRTERKAS